MDTRTLSITRYWTAAIAAGVLAALAPAASTAPATAPSPAEAYRTGMRQFAQRDLGEAGRSFRRAADGGSGYAGLCAWNMVGQVARLRGDLPGALEAFVAVEKAAPGVVRSAAGVVARNAGLLGELAVLYQAEILESQEKWDAALQRYEQLLQRAAEAPRARESFVQDPYCRERIARLYWRLGRTDQALRILEAVLADTPDYPRAPLLRLVVLSLSRGAEGGEQSALAYLSAPLGATADAVADAPDAAGQSANPLLGPLRELSAGQPEGSAWLPVLRLRCGWMLLEAGQREEAREQFRLASSLANGAGAGLAVVKSYADLSLALCCAHHGDPDQAARLAQGIVAAGGRGHPQEVAAQILTGLGWYRDQQKKAEKCSVRPLP